MRLRAFRLKRRVWHRANAEILFQTLNYQRRFRVDRLVSGAGWGAFVGGESGSVSGGSLTAELRTES